MKNRKAGVFGETRGSYKRNCNVDNSNEMPISRQQSTRELLEMSRLSRFPASSKINRLPKLKTLEHPNAGRSNCCGACNGKLDADNDFQQQARVCQKCLSNYSVVDLLLNERADEKIRQSFLGRLEGGAR